MGTEDNTTPSDKYFNEITDTIKQKVEAEKGIDELLKSVYYHRLLLKITRSINTPQEFNQLLELIVDSAITLTKAERGFLMLFRNDGSLEFKVTRNISRKILEGEQFKISRTVVNYVLATENPLFLSDIYKDKKFEISESIEALGLRMVMCVPLKAKKNILGVIYVDSHLETATFTIEEKKIFEAFAAQASVAIENSHLYDSSVHDSLTGLYNYGYLRNRLEEEIVRAQGYKAGSISFILIDLDKFKTINDSYGHLFGNTILVKLAELISKNIRKYDVAARFGSDEFAIMMPDTDVNTAKHVAQQLQKELLGLKCTIGQEIVSVSASFGVSSFPVEKITDSENIIVEADHALFVAKTKGGNQIAVFGLRRDTPKYKRELIGESEVTVEVRKTIFKIANTDATVLISGETGTGKELVTKIIHQQSIRHDKPFVVVNCGAIPDNLLESELFGYEKGAFTGAYKKHKGKFEAAHGGTIFLDEVGELPIHLQVKLLRAIEQKEIERIGGKSPINVDVRVIAATNKNLENEIKRGRFRKDLYYRLSVATIHLPSLRTRPEDITALSDYYLKQMNSKYHKNFYGFTKNAMNAMLHHSWPGNVRELIHRIERAVIMSTGQYLNENDLGFTVAHNQKAQTIKESRAQAEKESIIQSLRYNHWNITHASKELGISRKTLRDLIKKHNITQSYT